MFEIFIFIRFLTKIIFKNSKSNVHQFVKAYWKVKKEHCREAGPPRGYRGPGAKLENEGPCVRDRSKQKGQKARESGELKLEPLLESCKLLLLGGSLNTSKEANPSLLAALKLPMNAKLKDEVKFKNCSIHQLANM